ncbi:hypothetical protein HYV82_03280 [Candidatus Woesearchaeota archaeon]|nr:hypothetical protein [Candidatus Woesearchaeota archaeon]
METMRIDYKLLKAMLIETAERNMALLASAPDSDIDGLSPQIVALKFAGFYSGDETSRCIYAGKARMTFGDLSLLVASPLLAEPANGGLLDVINMSRAAYVINLGNKNTGILHYDTGKNAANERLKRAYCRIGSLIVGYFNSLCWTGSAEPP